MHKEDNSYKSIFKSLGFIGGSQLLIILIGIVRTKLIAIILGPLGVGVSGIFQSIIDLVRNATSLGINYSGVKKIADISHEKDQELISKNIKILRRWSFATGLFGMFILILFSSYFSQESFSSSKFKYQIISLSIVVLFSSISSGQIALLQGLRKIKEMALASIVGAVLGTIISIPFFWFWGINGIVFGIIISSISTLLVSWYYANKVKVTKISLSFIDTYREGMDMAKTGLYIVSTLFISSISMYFVRSVISNFSGVNSVGLFQSVWAISTTYINVLLNSMLADYFPRLSKFSNDDINSNKLINEQLQVTILAGAPMIILLLSVGSLVIKILYSSEFIDALPILQWQLFSSFMNLIIWPLGVIYLARNKGKYMFLSEIIKQFFYLAVIYPFWKIFGFEILGIGFFVSFLGTLIFTIYSVKSISNFRFNKINLINILVLSLCLICEFLSVYLFKGYLSMTISSILFSFTAFYCLRQLNDCISLFSIINRYKSQYITKK